MNEPHFFVSSQQVINLNHVLHAFLGEKEVRVSMIGGVTVVIKGDDVGEFALMCARYHHFARNEKWPGKG